MKQNQIQTKLQLSYAQLKSVQPWGAAFFEYHWSHCIVFSWVYGNPCCEKGQRWRTLCIRAKAFQSMYILHSVRMWNKGHQHMNNEFVMDADGLHAFYVLCVKKTAPQGCNSVHTYSVRQKGGKFVCIYSIGAGFLFANGFVHCCLQRDLFNQLLIHAAMKSDKKHHQKLGR